VNQQLHLFPSPDAASAAGHQLLAFAQEHNFLLHEQAGRDGFLPVDELVIEPLRSAQQELQAAQIAAKQAATAYLRQAWKCRGFGPPIVSESEELVLVNSYGGMLDICTAWPLANLSQGVPTEESSINSELDRLAHSRSLHLLPQVSRLIINELNDLHAWDSQNNRVVVLLRTRFGATPQQCNQLFGERLREHQVHAHALAYLFYQAVSPHVLGPTTPVLFSTDPESPVVLRGARLSLSEKAENTVYGKAFFAVVI
jgi:hypothetical protein